MFKQKVQPLWKGIWKGTSEYVYFKDNKSFMNIVRPEMGPCRKPVSSYRYKVNVSLQYSKESIW